MPEMPKKPMSKPSGAKPSGAKSDAPQQRGGSEMFSLDPKTGKKVDAHLWDEPGEETFFDLADMPDGPIPPGWKPKYFTAKNAPAAKPAAKVSTKPVAKPAAKPATKPPSR